MGIDPGAKGCACIISQYIDEPVIFRDYEPDNEKKYFEKLCYLHSQTPIFTVLEKVSAMPGQGVTSMFSFGRNLGLWEGFLMLVRYPYRMVSPQTWQKELGISKPTKTGNKAIDKKAIKEAIKQHITRLFPNAELYGKRGAYLEGRGDALCLAYYARQIYLGEKTNG